jgi:hypothetical protein
MKKYVILFCMAAALLLWIGGTLLSSPPQASGLHGLRMVWEDDVMNWHGFELTREDFTGTPFRRMVFQQERVPVPQNVFITADEQKILTIFLGISGGEVVYELTAIQVELNGKWYTLPQQLFCEGEPLTVSSWQLNYTFNLSAIELDSGLPAAGLPPGRYRLVKSHTTERFWYLWAYFWVIEPGDAPPPESVTIGAACLEDITFFARSPHGARRQITDQDAWFSLHIRNLSGKEYRGLSDGVVLEQYLGGEWTEKNFKHANQGSLSGWSSTTENLFLNEPLEAGTYRLRLTMHTMFGFTNQPIFPEYVFTVYPHETVPESQWDAAQLTPSPFNFSPDPNPWSGGIKMVLTDPVLNQNNPTLELNISARHFAHYSFGEDFSIEVLLDGTWYRVPPAGGVGYINLIGHSLGWWKIQHERSPAHYAGILPEGQYRIIKSFDRRRTLSDREFLGREFAAAEFTVEETLERHYSW